MDSAAGNIITSKNDTIRIDYGRYSDPFEEVIPVISLAMARELDSLGIEYVPGAVVSIRPQIDQDQGLYLKEYYYYEDIDDKRAKIGIPKNSGQGRMSIHFYKVDSFGNKLSMSVSNIDSDIQIEILNMFKSIRFLTKN
ncbi:hypothetical protein [Siphonobacter curvatus]|nr:hypothetical protein [Siphonobacter curvatus]